MKLNFTIFESLMFCEYNIQSIATKYSYGSISWYPYELLNTVDEFREFKSNLTHPSHEQNTRCWQWWSHHQPQQQLISYFLYCTDKLLEMWRHILINKEQVRKLWKRQTENTPLQRTYIFDLFLNFTTVAPVSLQKIYIYIIHSICFTVRHSFVRVMLSRNLSIPYFW